MEKKHSNLLWIHCEIRFSARTGKRIYRKAQDRLNSIVTLILYLCVHYLISSLTFC